MSHFDKKGSLVKSFHKSSLGHLVYPISNNLVDFFWGEGFSGWARLKWTGKEWALWKKNSNLPKDFVVSLEEYRKEAK